MRKEMMEILDFYFLESERNGELNLDTLNELMLDLKKAKEREISPLILPEHEKNPRNRSSEWREIDTFTKKLMKIDALEFFKYRMARAEYFDDYSTIAVEFSEIVEVKLSQKALEIISWRFCGETGGMRSRLENR
jgi:hypothetical protein